MLRNCYGSSKEGLRHRRIVPHPRMLKNVEPSIKKKPSKVSMVQMGKGFKRMGTKGKTNKAKGFGKTKSKVVPMTKIPKKGACHFCNESGHWKRNCKFYLEDLKKKGSETTTSGS